jgi:flagellin-like protein
MRNKRAISAVVATVLLILLTIVAITVLASLVVPFVKDNLSGGECIKYKDYFSFEEKIEGKNYNCFDSPWQGLTIKTKPDVNNSKNDLGGFFITLIGDDRSQTYRVYQNGSGFSERVLGESKFYYPKPGETITYVFNTGFQYNTAIISPMLQSDKVCDKDDEIKIISCESGVILSG